MEKPILEIKVANNNSKSCLFPYIHATEKFIGIKQEANVNYFWWGEKKGKQKMFDAFFHLLSIGC